MRDRKQRRIIAVAVVNDLVQDQIGQRDENDDDSVKSLHRRTGEIPAVETGRIGHERGEEQENESPKNGTPIDSVNVFPNAVERGPKFADPEERDRVREEGHPQSPD